MKWLFGTCALLLLGLFLKLSLLVYAMYVLLGILLLSRFFTRLWIDELSATRSCDADVLEIGESAEVEVRVRNGGRFTVPWLIIEDSLPRAALTQMPLRMRAEGARLLLAKLGPGQTQTVRYRVSFLMRGYYQLGPSLVETGDVFGLHRRYRIVAEPRFVMVLPKVLPLVGYNLASRRPIGEIRVAHRLFEDPTRLACVRPYQHGDPLNRIHWRATARTGELHSRVYESSRVAGATFLLDFHADNFQGPAAAAATELAVTTVTSLANSVFLMGQQIGLVTNGRDAADRVREAGWQAEFTTREAARTGVADVPRNTRLRPVIVETGKGEGRFAQILATLARLEHTDGMEFAGLIEEAAARIPRDATVLPVLRRVTPAIAGALGNLSRRGFLVTAIVVVFGGTPIPDWAHPPDWAEMLLAEGIDFRVVIDEDAISNLCVAALVR